MFRDEAEQYRKGRESAYNGLWSKAVKVYQAAITIGWQGLAYRYVKLEKKMLKVALEAWVSRSESRRYVLSQVRELGWMSPQLFTEGTNEKV